MRIAACILALSVSLLCHADDASCDFTIARLKYDGGGDWYANPSSLPNLVEAVKARTDVDICDSIATVELLHERLFRFPFIYMTGHGNVRLSHQERLALRSYLEAGGFLWADDNYGMDRSFRREMQALFPDHTLSPLPASHAVFSAHYRLPGLPKIHEHDGEPAQALGITFDDRLVVLYTYSADIGDGLEDPDVHNDGPKLHELALKMGVNIVTWFLKP